MNRIKELRKDNNITIETISKELGIPKTTLNNYENGKRTPRHQETWEKLADYFNVSEAYIMGISDERFDELEILKEIKNIFFERLDKEKDKEKRDALSYYNNSELDQTLLRLIISFFENSNNSNFYKRALDKDPVYLYELIEKKLIDTFFKKSVTNQNLIQTIYTKIPSKDYVSEYKTISDDVFIPLNHEDVTSLKEQIKNELQNQLDIVPKSYFLEIDELFDNATSLISYKYEKSIDENLEQEINSILDDARSKLENLKNKYTNKQSDIRQINIILDKDSNFRSPELDKVFNDEKHTIKINLSKTTKLCFDKKVNQLLEQIDIDLNSKD